MKREESKFTVKATTVASRQEGDTTTLWEYKGLSGCSQINQDDRTFPQAHINTSMLPLLNISETERISDDI